MTDKTKLIDSGLGFYIEAVDTQEDHESETPAPVRPVPVALAVHNVGREPIVVNAVDSDGPGWDVARMIVNDVCRKFRPDNGADLGAVDVKVDITVGPHAATFRGTSDSEGQAVIRGLLYNVSDWLWDQEHAEQ